MRMKLKLNKVFKKHMKYWYVFNKYNLFRKKRKWYYQFYKYDDDSILSIFISNDDSKNTRVALIRLS